MSARLRLIVERSTARIRASADGVIAPPAMVSAARISSWGGVRPVGASASSKRREMTRCSRPIREPRQSCVISAANSSALCCICITGGATVGGVAATLPDRSTIMSRLDAGHERNAASADGGAHEHATIMPRLQIAVLPCLAPRVDPAVIFGLRLGEAVVLRNAGGRVTGAVVEDLAFIGQMAEAAVPDGPLFEVAVVHHTGCGTALLAAHDRRARYARRIHAAPAALAGRAVVDPEATVREDVALLRADPAIPDRVAISGHLYDVATGRVRTVIDAALVAAR